MTFYKFLMAVVCRLGVIYIYLGAVEKPLLFMFASIPIGSGMIR